MATLKDIANELNVSVALVSKVLNNSKSTTGASAKTADAIRETAAKLGYTRNRTALSLRTGRHNTIGVLLHRTGASGSGLTESLLSGIAEEALKFEQHQELTFFETDEQLQKSIAMARDSITDGLIIGGVPHLGIVDQLLELKKSGMPVVTNCYKPLHPDIPNVDADSLAVGKVATQHLIDRGCKRIACIKTIGERNDGYRQTLQAENIDYDPALVFKYEEDENDSFSFKAGQAAVKYFLDNNIPFDGFFASSDSQAMGVIKSLLNAGKQVPQDVKIVGVDNSPLGEFGIVSTSSVSADTQRCGRLSVRMLMQLLDGQEVQSVTIEPTVVARESTAM